MVALLKGFFFKETVSIYRAYNNNIRMDFLQMQGVVIDINGIINSTYYICYMYMFTYSGIVYFQKNMKIGFC